MTNESTSPEEKILTALESAQALLDKGAFAKAEKLIKDLDPDVEEVQKMKVLIHQARSEKRAKAKKIEKPQKKKVKASAPRTVTHESILESFEKLDADLSVLESRQRNIQKPFRHVFFTRRRLEVIALNFKKATMRRVR